MAPEIVVRCLLEEGVEFVFGHSALCCRMPMMRFTNNDIAYVLRCSAGCRARRLLRRAPPVTGRVGHLRAGLTNAVTGIATAYMDSIPLIVLSARCRPSWIGMTPSRKSIWSASPAPVKHNFLAGDG
ncbi:MAG: thiamine pyrophosphate-binding protein [Gammaproteobacteria bacterium]